MESSLCIDISPCPAPSPRLWKLKVLVTQSCPALCNPRVCNPPASSVHGLLQARILEWIAIAFSTVSSQPRGQTRVSCAASKFFTVWATREVQEYYSRVARLPPENLLHPGIEPMSLMPPVLAGGLATWEAPGYKQFQALQTINSFLHSYLLALYLKEQINRTFLISEGIFE